MLQGLLSMAISQGTSLVASMLLERLQAGTSGDTSAVMTILPMTDMAGVVAAAGRRVAMGSGSRRVTRYAARPTWEAGSRSGRGRRAGACPGRDTEEVGWGSETPGDGGDSGDGIFELPDALIHTGIRSAGAAAQRLGQPNPRLSLQPPLPPVSPAPDRERASEDDEGREEGAGADAAAVAQAKADLKARAREARAAHAAEVAAQQEWRRLEQRKMQQQARRQQQLLAKKRMQQQAQQGESRVAEHAGTEMREYILQERQKLRRKLGLDQETDVEGHKAAAAAAAGGKAAQPSSLEARTGGDAATPTPDVLCKCCLRDDAMDPRVAAAAVGLSKATGGGDAAMVARCLVDSDLSTVGPRQRRLVVRCSGGCQMDFHYPGCWRQMEALLRAARSDYHGLKVCVGLFV